MPDTVIDDTFAEAFPMAATRLIITADDPRLAKIAATEFSGNASSVIGCDAEAAIEGPVDAASTPDGRAGISVLAFAFSRKALEQAIAARVGQNVLTCPGTACYAGLDPENCDKQVKLGGQLRFFGDGHQIAKKLGGRRYWRVPVMDGEFVCDDVVGVVTGIGGGNLLVVGHDAASCLAGALEAAEAIHALPDVIMPFPSGVVRSGSKVGSKYAKLKASTNDKWCPTLKGQVASELQDDEHAVYEIVIDGLSESAVAQAMSTGLQCLQQHPGVTRVSAGNYGGKLGPHHFHLQELLSKANNS